VIAFTIPSWRPLSVAPYRLYVHGASDTTGAVRIVERLTTGLKWKAALPPVLVTGALDQASRDACWELVWADPTCATTRSRRPPMYSAICTAVAPEAVRTLRTNATARRLEHP
jgi:hypothetical protein